jgi:hypothetical protein
MMLISVQAGIARTAYKVVTINRAGAGGVEAREWGVDLGGFFGRFFS